MMVALYNDTKRNTSLKEHAGSPGKETNTNDLIEVFSVFF
jgi:hypothetical protein